MLLLDTHALLWLDSGAPLATDALVAIEGAQARGGVLVSPVTAREIGMLVRKARIRLDMEPAAWLERFMALPGVVGTPLT